jgi:dipeptidyl aminopeptidase/acylaminoacyl peptidase
VGASYGAYAALAGAAFTPDAYQCAASINGVSDLPLMLQTEQREGGRESDSVAYWRDHIGSPFDPKVAERSPARAAAAVRVPVLLLHGEDDTVVPIAQSERMARALSDAGKAVRFERLAGEDHWLSESATRIKVLTELERFLASHLAAKP